MSEKKLQRPHPAFDRARIAHGSDQLDTMNTADRKKYAEALIREKRRELQTTINRLFRLELSNQDADFILSRLIGLTPEHHQELASRFPKLESYFNQVLQRRA